MTPDAAGAADPTAELARLDLEIGVLASRAEAARHAWYAADSILRATQQRRGQLAASLRVPTQPGPSRPTPLSEPIGPLPPSGRGLARQPGTAPETSTRTVQNVLFILGGLLLGTAAIVFTAVAWATFGVAGRAAILAVVTAVALAAPLLALRRRLTATAETFAGLGLLLLLLDGYAAWYVNLFAVASLPASRYVGLVCLATAVLAAAYRRLTGLGSAAFAALLVIQPVIPALVVAAHPGAAGWSMAFAVVALIDLAVAWRRRGAVRVLAWILFALATTIAGLLALGAEILAEDVRPSALAGLALCLAGSLGVLAATVTRSTVGYALSAAVFTVTVIIAGGRFALAQWPDYRPIAATAVVAIVAGLARLCAPILPAGARPGARVGALVAAGLVGLGLIGMAVAAAGASIANAVPIWHASLTGNPVDHRYTVVGLALIALAIAFSSPRSVQSTIVAVAVAAAALLLPHSITLTWWAPAAIDVAAAAVLVIGSVLASTNGTARAPAVAALVLVLHAVAVSLIRPVSTAAVAAALVGLGVLIAWIGRRRADPSRLPDRAAGYRHLAGAALVIALLALPVAVGAGLAAAQIAPWWVGRATTAAVGLLVVCLAAVRRWWPTLTWPAFGAVLAATIIWPTAGAFHGHESISVYAAVELLLLATILLVMRAGSTAPAVEVSGPLLGLAAVPATFLLIIDVTGAFAYVLIFPYSWLGSVWSGQPTGVGLTASNSAPAQWLTTTTALTAAHAVALGVLAAAVAITGYAITQRTRSALAGLFVGAPSGVLIALAATDVAWPAVCLASLALGWLLALVAGLAPGRVLSRATATAQAFAFVGAGLAGTLATRWSTLASLGASVVVAAIVGAVGRGVAARTFGWLAAAGLALATAAAAGFAADLSVRDTAFCLLGVAAAALYGGAALTRRGPTEAVAVQAVGYGGAVVALAFTVGWTGHAAAVCTLWGLVVGGRALWPGSTRLARAALTSVAAGCELLAWWLLLADRGVAILEAYSVPLAAVALLAGWLALRARPELRSWVAYGPALAAAFLPDLATIVVASGEPWRRLGLGTAALLVLVAGAVRRRQAPVVVGGLVLAIVALHELVLVWDRLPRWIPLAVGGVVLVALAMTYERRRRDMAALTTALRHMR